MVGVSHRRLISGLVNLILFFEWVRYRCFFLFFLDPIVLLLKICDGELKSWAHTVFWLYGKATVFKIITKALNYGIGNKKAESYSFFISLGTFFWVDFSKGFKELAQLFFFDPYTCVFYGDHINSWWFKGDLHGNRAFFCEFKRVSQQID